MLLKEQVEAVNKSASEFINRRADRNLVAGSNGETAMIYLTEEITDNALYLLDEPENSLAPKLQLELKQFIEDSARFFWMSVYYSYTLATSPDNERGQDL